MVLSVNPDDEILYYEKYAPKTHDPIRFILGLFIFSKLNDQSFAQKETLESELNRIQDASIEPSNQPSNESGTDEADDDFNWGQHETIMRDGRDILDKLKTLPRPTLARQIGDMNDSYELLIASSTLQPSVKRAILRQQIRRINYKIEKNILSSEKLLSKHLPRLLDVFDMRESDTYLYMKRKWKRSRSRSCLHDLKFKKNVDFDYAFSKVPTPFVERTRLFVNMLTL
jgi:hypothetical protein